RPGHHARDPEPGRHRLQGARQHRHVAGRQGRPGPRDREDAQPARELPQRVFAPGHAADRPLLRARHRGEGDQVRPLDDGHRAARRSRHRRARARHPLRVAAWMAEPRTRVLTRWSGPIAGRILLYMDKIIPISDLQTKAKQYVEQVKETDQPVVITQRGRAAAVLVSYESYEGLLATR